MRTVTTSSVVIQRRSSKSPSKDKLEPNKKVMVTVWWSTAVLIYYSFLNPSEPLHLRSILRILMRCTQNATPAAGIAQQIEPNSSLKQFPTTTRTTNTSKIECIFIQKLTIFLPHLPCSPDLWQLITTSSSTCTTFCSENASTTKKLRFHRKQQNSVKHFLPLFFFLFLFPFNLKKITYFY